MGTKHQILPSREVVTYEFILNTVVKSFNIKGMPVNKAQKFMDDVLAFKTCVPFRKYTGGIGHHAMAKLHKAPGSKGRWPVKATAVLRDLLANAISNARRKALTQIKCTFLTVKPIVLHQEGGERTGHMVGLENMQVNLLTLRLF